MSRLRVPVVAGRTAGVGTSTLAAALHAVDGGRWAGGPVDVLVCSADDDLAALPPVPVLVLRGGAAAVPAPSRGGAVVVLPEVAAWAGADATRAAAGLLGLGPAHRPAALHGYAEALLAVTAALVRSGVLAREPGGPARRRPDGRASAAPSAPAHRPGHPAEPLARPADAATSAHPARA
ncbi:MAG: hypothetical protein NTW05_25795, partial [Pseudonocardiales bacterium]|nr:hypothetical protein [Pseudonocardiales bacterium]